MVKQIKMGNVKPTKSLNFEKIIASGQNPDGFTAQTANGTARAGNCAGWNRQYPFYKWPEVEATGAWTQANRSGE
jgi:hypothetical protein